MMIKYPHLNRQDKPLDFLNRMRNLASVPDGDAAQRHAPKEYRREDIVRLIRNRCLLAPLDVLLLGSTGSGKSSTVNALIGETVTKVGDGVAPETRQLSEHEMHAFLRFHDSAGLGDGVSADETHAAQLTNILTQRCNEKYGFIDLSLVVLDGGSRDLGTTLRLLELVLLKYLTPERVIVAINQADMAMKGRHWDEERNQPTRSLSDYLTEKSLSVQRRLQESTGLRIKVPICYSASKQWNIDQLMDHIIDHTPTVRRIL